MIAGFPGYRVAAEGDQVGRTDPIISRTGRQMVNLTLTMGVDTASRFRRGSTPLLTAGRSAGSDPMVRVGMGRMQSPSQPHSNWRWRYLPRTLQSALSARLAELTHPHRRN